jgi:hypothetical protein
MKNVMSPAAARWWSSEVAREERANDNWSSPAERQEAARQMEAVVASWMSPERRKGFECMAMPAMVEAQRMRRMPAWMRPKAV